MSFLSPCVRSGERRLCYFEAGKRRLNPGGGGMCFLGWRVTSSRCISFCWGALRGRLGARKGILGKRLAFCGAWGLS